MELETATSLRDLQPEIEFDIERLEAAAEACFKAGYETSGMALAGVAGNLRRLRDALVACEVWEAADDAN